MLKVSVITTAYRPGGLDITLAGMLDQTYPNFEVIIVDKRYNKRHNDVMKLAEDYGIRDKIIHLPEHRMNGKWTTFCSAWNTGMALATGDLLIFLCDWMYVHSSWIEAHIRAHEVPNRYVAAPYIHTDLPELTKPYPYDNEKQRQRGDRCTEPDDVFYGSILEEMLTFKGGAFDPKWIPLLKRHEYPHQDSRFTWQPTSTEIGPNAEGWMHIKHESLSRELAYRLNGLDERLERGKGPMDIDYQMRLTQAGVSLWWDVSIPPGICPNPRFYCRTMPWGDMKERLEGRWSYDDGLAYIRARQASIQSAKTKEEREQLIRAKNPYSLAGLAKRIAPWKNGEEPKPLEVDDMTYWGREIWPETDDDSPIHNAEWPHKPSITLGGADSCPYDLKNGFVLLYGESIDNIKTINFLDQQPTEMVEKLLAECYRVLKMSGVLFIQLTDGQVIARDADALTPTFQHLKSIFTQDTLTVILKRIGFRHIVFAGKETQFDFRMNAVK